MGHISKAFWWELSRKEYTSWFYQCEVNFSISGVKCQRKSCMVCYQASTLAMGKFRHFLLGDHDIFDRGEKKPFKLLRVLTNLQGPDNNLMFNFERAWCSTLECWCNNKNIAIPPVLHTVIDQWYCKCLRIKVVIVAITHQ